MELTNDDIQKIRAALMDEIRAEIKKEVDLSNQKTDKDLKDLSVALQNDADKKIADTRQYIDDKLNRAFDELEIQRRNR